MGSLDLRQCAGRLPSHGRQGACGASGGGRQLARGFVGGGGCWGAAQQGLWGAAAPPMWTACLHQEGAGRLVLKLVLKVQPGSAAACRGRGCRHQAPAQHAHAPRRAALHVPDTELRLPWTRNSRRLGGLLGMGAPSPKDRRISPPSRQVRSVDVWAKATSISPSAPVLSWHAVTLEGGLGRQRAADFKCQARIAASHTRAVRRRPGRRRPLRRHSWGGPPRPAQAGAPGSHQHIALPEHAQAAGSA